MPMTLRPESGEPRVRTDDTRPDHACADTEVHPAWQGPASKSPAPLHHFFECSCHTHPGNLGLIRGDGSPPSAALDARANQLAHYLLRRGLRPGDRVGLLLERSAHAYAALLAVLKCGSAFVPLDPSFPAERIAYIAGDADLRLLVTAAKFGDAVAGAECPILALDADAAAVAAEPASHLTLAENVDPLCYIIYTSGTTGRPKGVAAHHSTICNYLPAWSGVYSVTPPKPSYPRLT